MKLDILSREISEITVTDDVVHVSLLLSISHGQVKKVVTPITIEHTVPMAVLLPGGDPTGTDDAMVMAIAGANRRADEALAAIRGLDKL